MYKKILNIIICVSLISLFCINSGFALSTYVGIKILDLRDDASYSCVGQSGYGDQGRIRGLVSNPDDGYPIYFKVYKVSDGTVIREMNSTADTDYEKGDTIVLPQSVDLIPGEEYGVFFDIDAYKIYLPLVDHGSFRATINDTYWTIGRKVRYENVYTQYSSGDTCSYGGKTTKSFGNDAAYHKNGLGITNNRSNIASNCWDDNIDYNCHTQGGMAIGNEYPSAADFKMFASYVNLYTSTVGNFEFTFVFN